MTTTRTSTGLLQALRRRTMLAALGVSETVLGVAGRRKPYGILSLEIGGELSEEETEQRFLGVFRRSADDYLSLITLLRWARDDQDLRGVLIRCNAINASWARLQEVRRLIDRLRQAGKRVWVHLNVAGVHEYYLASAAEHITLTPAATLDVTGLSSEAVFVAGALEKVGIHADVVQMGRYKAAGEMFTRREMSSAHREMIESLVDDLYGQIVDDVAASRRLTSARVRELFDHGPLLARETLAGQLIDEVAYEDEAVGSFGRRCGDAAVIERRDYARRRGREVRRQLLRTEGGALALLRICGTIKSGESLPGPEGISATGSRSIATALKEARERSDVRAVIVRVASPGGSGVASDLIWRELVRTREQKPVVISFGDVAASGGYYLAMAGDAVICEAGTITGSIGVLAGRANLRGLYDRLGITKEVVSRGKHAALYSDYAPLGASERERIQAEAESFYATFVEKVATARHLTQEDAAAAAEGRVWTGRQAWARGLVDGLGGLEDALDLAKQRAGVPRDAPMVVESFPRPRRLLKLALDLNVPRAGPLSDLVVLLSSAEHLWRDRVWALLPFTLRFR